MRRTMLSVSGVIAQSVPFDPTSISGLQVWLDASDRGSTTNRWDDKSGNNNHYTAASAGEFPTFSGGVATFNGTSHHLDGPSLAGLTAGSVFIRIKKPGADPFDSTTGIAHFGTNGANNHYTYGGTIYIGFGINARPVWGTGGDELVWHNLSTEVSAAGAYKGHTHNVLRYSGTHAPSWNSAPTFGKSIGGFYLTADVKALCIYNKVLSTEERSSLETYLDEL